MDARDAAYSDLAALLRRAGPPVRAIEALAAADAFRSMGLGRRQALWRARALAGATPLPLFEAMGETGEGTEPVVSLPAMAAGERTIEDYRALRLSLGAHPLSFLRARLATRGALPAEDVFRARNGQRAAAAGLVLARQRPGSAKGTIFMTLEDETGVANVVVRPVVLGRSRRAVLGGRLVLARGRIQRAGAVVHLIAARLENLTSWLDLLTPDAAAARDGKRPAASAARHPRNERAIPRSRDFR